MAEARFYEKLLHYDISPYPRRHRGAIPGEEFSPKEISGPGSGKPRGHHFVYLYQVNYPWNCWR